MNKKPCLNAGWIEVVSVQNDGKALQKLQNEHFNAQIVKDLYTLGSMTVAIRCPLFVQLNLSKFGFKIITSYEKTLEAYIPNETEIGAATLEDCQTAQGYIQATTEALLLNTQTLPMDGVDKFVAQVMTPVSTYTTLIVHGSLESWMNYINQRKLPSQLETYRSQIHEELKVHWYNIDIIRFPSNR